MCWNTIRPHEIHSIWFLVLAWMLWHLILQKQGNGLQLKWKCKFTWLISKQPTLFMYSRKSFNPLWALSTKILVQWNINLSKKLPVIHIKSVAYKCWISPPDCVIERWPSAGQSHQSFSDGRSSNMLYANCLPLNMLHQSRLITTLFQCSAWKQASERQREA